MTQDDWNAARAAHQRGDYATAVALYRALAEAGSARAQDNLGVMYESGLGVPKSYAEALKWYRRAAAQGNHDAQNNLGVMYEHGHGVPKDPVAAVQWYRKAAEQGDTNAQHNLGNAYQSGLGVAQDHAEAVAWYRKAAEARHPMAQANLGVMYEHGHGVRQDFVEAHKWYTLSAMTFRASEAKSRGLVIRNRDQLVAQDDAGRDRGSAPARPRMAAEMTARPRLQSPALAAPTTASAVRLTSRRTVAEGVAISTVFCAPSRIGPMVTPSPPVIFSRLNEMFAASRFGITSRFASPFSVESGWTWLRMASDRAASPCISPSTSRSGARCDEQAPHLAHLARGLRVVAAEIGVRQQRDLRHEAEPPHGVGRQPGDPGQLFGRRVPVHVGVADEQRAVRQQQPVHRREHRRIGSCGR